MPRPTARIPPESLLLYEKLVATIPGVERKGATIPYTSLNGHMFSYLNPRGSLALRLPEKEREAFLARYGAKLSEVHGIVQKEYVLVPDALLGRTAELKKYLARSFAYVGSLPPKPTTRKAKAKRSQGKR